MSHRRRATHAALVAPIVLLAVMRMALHLRLVRSRPQARQGAER